APGRGREAEVEEARAGDLDRGDVVAARQRVHQRLGQRARVRLRRPGEQHRGVGGEIAVRAVLRPLDDEVWRGEVGRQGACVAQDGDGLFDQAAELGFHGGLRLRPAAHFTRSGRAAGPAVPAPAGPRPDPAGDGQTQPRAASDTGAPSPITKWSSRRTSTSASDCLSWAVTARSAALGSGFPLGWLWPTITAAALWASARRTTSRGCTSAPSMVPRNSSSNASARWRVSRNRAA